MTDSILAVLVARAIKFCGTHINSIKYFLLATFFLLQSYLANSQQQRIDSLHADIQKFTLKDNFSKKDTSYINALVRLGEAYQYISSDSVLAITQRVERLSRNAKYTYGILKAYNLYGEHYIRNGNIDKAKEKYGLGLSLVGADTPEGQNQTILMMVNFGFYNLVSGDYSKALGNFLKGADLASAAGNTEQLSKIYENIAIIYSVHNDFKQSIFFFEMAMALNEESKDELAITQTALNTC